MEHFIIGTAGHIDHGKTSLIKALTGTDTDRLKEERERKITIDIGFAFLGEDITFIDVPGHEKFIKNMITGISSIDLALLVIAADDGVMPQTREHLDIMNLLQIKDFIIVITKIDKVEDDWLELVEDDINEFLENNNINNAKIFKVDSLANKGIAELKQHIIENAKNKNYKSYSDIFKLDVDRVFSQKGYGTVITGTVLSGNINKGDNVELLPEKTNLKVRSLQCHGKDIDSLSAGYRAALNLHGECKGIMRGSILASQDYLTSHYMYYAKVTLLMSSDTLLEHDQRLRIHTGTKETFARISLIDNDQTKNTKEYFIQLRFEEKLALSFQEKFIIRTYSPQLTIGGGIILIPSKSRFKQKDVCIIENLKLIADNLLDKSALGIVSFYNYIELSNLKKLLFRSQELTYETISQIKEIKIFQYKEKIVLIHEQFKNIIQEQILKDIDNYHTNNPYAIGMPHAEQISKISQKYHVMIAELLIDDMLVNKSIKMSSDKLALENFKPQIDEEMKKNIIMFLKIINSDEFQPRLPEKILSDIGIPSNMINPYIMVLQRDYSLVKIDEKTFFTNNKIEEAQQALIDISKEKNEFTISDLSQKLNSSRKFMLPLLEYFDSQNITIRNGNTRTLR